MNGCLDACGISNCKRVCPFVDGRVARNNCCGEGTEHNFSLDSPQYKMCVVKELSVKATKWAEA